MRHSVAEKIRDKLEQQNLSVLGLEKKAGLKVHAVQNILTGHSKRPNIDTLLAIANALGCNLSDLIDEPTTQTPASKTKVEKYGNFKLLGEISSYLINEMEQFLDDVAPQTLNDFTQEVYIYCEKNKGGTFDKDFAIWVLDRLK